MTEVIWTGTVDGRWRCEVTRKDGRQGVLAIYDTTSDDDPVRPSYEVNVDLSYGATFGPDVADVLHWQQLCEEFIDKVKAK